MNRTIEAALQTWLAELLGEGYLSAKIRPAGTGCINETWEAYGAGIDSVFVKAGPAAAAQMYTCEQHGLDALRQCDAIRVPQVLGCTTVDDAAFLALEFVAMHSPKPEHDRVMGEALAQLHSLRGEAFGFSEANFIGRSLQVNDGHQDWWLFWCDCRMRPQLRLSELRNMRQALRDKIGRLLEAIPAQFGDHHPEPVLLHGDLWSGNWAVDSAGKPCLFDPAVYYGDAETDIAMTKMFGGFRPQVYDVYHHYHPLQAGHELRRVLYDTYHWLNHFNLFGVTYLGHVENNIDQLLATMD